MNPTEAVGLYEGMGLATVYDYSDFGGQFKDRIGHCYQIVGQALLNHEDDDPIPYPVAIVHGSWHGPDAPERIGHAIVLLSSGKVWEPITAGVYDRDKFISYTQWKGDQIYTAREARELMLNTGHFGPWESE